MSVPYQVPINGTYQKRIPPGSQTNVYYILLSNLPWQTSWQQLKDHVRMVCPVERVEVFNESTTGWVSVRGRDNFDAAFDLLNGGIFNGRPLFANGKNATEPVMIKEPVDTQGSHQHVPRSSRSIRPSNPLPLHYQEPTAQITSYDKWASSSPSPPAILPPSTDYQLHAGMHSQIHGHRDTPRYHPSFTERKISNHDLAYDWPCTAPPYLSDSYQNDFAPRQFRPEIFLTPGRSTTHHILAREGVYPTIGYPTVDHEKTHKIIIRHIAPHITHQQFEELVRHKIGYNVDDFAEVELPISDTHDSNRGFAVAHFYTETAASRAVRKLQGTIFANRALKVELKKSSARDSTNRSARSRKPCKDDRERRDKKETSDASSSGNKTRCSQKSDVVIANGSSSKSSSYKI